MHCLGGLSTGLAVRWQQEGSLSCVTDPFLPPFLWDAQAGGESDEDEDEDESEDEPPPPPKPRAAPLAKPTSPVAPSGTGAKPKRASTTIDELVRRSVVTRHSMSLYSNECLILIL